ncbi:YceI family protein [Lysinibacillus endophyticus]|uniref:YceI family protein n=1 Tax=Ureibacillus endophyticus TaxID=1978490 RepID=A0A494ZA83_9BACL|nr:YceI family protein [Lysinibacillus endophyticus]
MYFTSNEIISIDECTYNLNGDLTIKEVTNPITFTTIQWSHEKSLGLKKYGLLGKKGISK